MNFVLLLTGTCHWELFGPEALNSQQTKGIAFVKVASNPELLGCGGKVPGPYFEPFIFDGLVSLSNRNTDLKPVRIERRWRFSD